MILLVLSTLAKIAFFIAVLLGIAPLLVWADRRQSAMMQDRVGPHRAGIPVPGFVADLIQGPLAWGARIISLLSALLLVFSVLMVAAFLIRPDLESVWSLPQWTILWPLTLVEIPARLTFFANVAFFALVSMAFHWVAGWFVYNLVEDNRITAFGFIHPAVDAVKMIWKEDFTPPKADKLLFSIAPIIAVIPVFATFAVIPFGPTLYLGPPENLLQYVFSVVDPATNLEGATAIALQVANLNVGILYIFAIAGTGIVGAAIAGYSSDNKYALLGGLRAASQMVSYEVTLGLTLVGCFMIYGSLLLPDFIAWQVENTWGVFVQPLALILFFFAAIAEMKRIPFDAPEGESEIVAGYFLEYSGMKFGMFMMGEYVEHVTSSAIIVTLFFGGYHVPFLEADGFHFAWLGYDIILWHGAVIALQIAAFLLKIGVCIFLQLQIRWTLPRFRYDQIMQLCWKMILPLSLANILLTGVAILLLS